MLKIDQILLAPSSHLTKALLLSAFSSKLNPNSSNFFPKQSSPLFTQHLNVDFLFNLVSADMQSVMKAIATVKAQVLVITTHFQNPTSTTILSWTMALSQLKIKDGINYSDKVGLSLWNEAVENLPTKFNMKAFGIMFVKGIKQMAKNLDGQRTSSKTPPSKMISWQSNKAHPNDAMLHKCIMVTLTTSAKLWLMLHRNNLNFNK